MSVSPDGHWVAGEMKGPQGSMVTVYDVTTGQTRPIELGNSAQWSPDSKRLVYQAPSAARVWSVDSGASTTVPTPGLAEWLPGGQLGTPELVIHTPGRT